MALVEYGRVPRGTVVVAELDIRDVGRTGEGEAGDLRRFSGAPAGRRGGDVRLDQHLRQHAPLLRLHGHAGRTGRDRVAVRGLHVEALLRLALRGGARGPLPPIIAPPPREEE